MRDTGKISSAMVAELAASEYTPFLLLFMMIEGDDYKYTDCDASIIVDGDVFSPRGITIQTVNYSMNQIVDQVELQFDSIDQALNSLFVGGTPQGESAILSTVVLDTSNAVVGTATIFQGTIDAWSLDEERLKVTFVNELSKWSQKTLSAHSASCRWKVFKGVECKYDDDEVWCDRTYGRCTALTNTANYGGFRWLPSIVDKAVWWGRVPSTEELTEGNI